MVHQELLPESNSLAIRLFVSEKYFVNVRQREIGPSQLCEVTIQVRSTFDFNIVYSIKDRLETLRCFSFNNDILAIQLFSPGKMISKIKYGILMIFYMFLLTILRDILYLKNHRL